MHKRVILFILFSLSIGEITAQRSVAAKTLISPNPGTNKFYYADRSDPARAIEFKERTVATSYFLTNINQYFNIPNEFTFIEAESNTDNLGMRHHLMQQYYKGIPLEGMVYRVHERNGFVTSANGRAVRNVNLDMHVDLSEENAFHLAKEYLNTKDTTVRRGKKLIVSKDFTFSPKSFSIAFQFDIDVSLIERWRISIDARDGHVINKISLVNSCLKEKESPLPYDTALGLTSYYGLQSIQVEKFGDGSSWLVGQTENGGTIETHDFQNASVRYLNFGFINWPIIYSPDNTYNTPYHKPAVSVQWAAERAYEYYYKKHNRNSFDNQGSIIKSFVHVDVDLNNAFWNGRVLAFGDGSNNNPLVELDVVGHEMTHGVTQYEASLEYYYESGALNESFSDILGKAVEFDTFGDSSTWQIAKHFSNGGLRNFSNPNLQNQPDTYAGDLWYTGGGDNGGVHYNSGVQNFWFYLLCEGGSGVNDHQVSYSVKSIGMDTAVNIAYRNLTEYLSSSSDYLDSRIGSLLATADLYGKNSTAYQEVDKAWDAVGVIDEPIITSLEFYYISATTVKIRASLLPRGDTVTYHFEYGTTPALGSSTSIEKYTNTVEGILTGLQSETKYYFRLVATNENGNTFFNSEFTTIPLAPLVRIKQTVDVTKTTATLYGEVNPNSLTTSFYFAYGTTPSLGLTTPTYPLSDTTEFVNVSAAIDNLQPRQTYYYKLIATNGFATSTTESSSFFTAVKPVINSYTPATAVIGSEVTISGLNFNEVPGKNKVSFGATRGIVLSSTSTEIKVQVPAGASLATISLLDTESGLSTESVQEFVPVYSGEFEKDNLQLRAHIYLTNYYYHTLVEDMDGDNRPDIIGAHYNGFTIFQNVNAGGDITNESFVTNQFPIAGIREKISAVDLDGNGLKDIVVRLIDGGFRIYPNLSVPGYIFFGPPVDLPTFYFFDLVFNDFDNDGHIDFAYIGNLQGDSSLIKVFRNQNPKEFFSADNFELSYEMTLPYSAYNIYSDDLNNDGNPDLIVSVFDKKLVPILKNNSQPGVFEFEEVITQDSTQGSSPQYLSQDLNQDGWKDIISYWVDVTMLENRSNSSDFLMEKPVILSGYAGATVQPGDINGDGKVDLLIGTFDGKFILLKNKAKAGEHLLDSSFEMSGKYSSGITTNTYNINVNDLNGDGRPDIISINDGYSIEIWQNSTNSCGLDPSLISLNVSKNSATILLPPNTTLDQFHIEYTQVGSTNWNQVSTTMLNLLPGYSYQLRASAKCYLGYSEYYYIDFTTDCVDLNSFQMTNVGIDNVSLSASDFSYFEIEYSLAGKDEWIAQPWYSYYIYNLLPGTTYDIRFRGRCNTATQFSYRQFTTLCPSLSSLAINELVYNKAVVSWMSNYAGNAILEYSSDNLNWTLIDETQTIFPLTPGKQYFVRGRMACTDSNSDFMFTSFTTPCPKVTMLSVSMITPFSARIDWLDESNTNNYVVTYSLISGGSTTTLETSSTFLNLDDLKAGAEYYVMVAPQCTDTQNFTSAIFTTVCYVPFNLLADEVTHTSAELSWSDNFSGLPYFVDYSISGSGVWETSETALPSFSLSELRPGTQYEVRVHITCLTETASYASLIFETKLYEETTFFPNPTDGKITIHPSKNLIGKHFSIYDGTGRKVADSELLHYTIDLTYFTSGMYTLKIDGEKIIKIIRQ